MEQLPKDPVILLSYINTQLRDFYPSLSEFCVVRQIEPEKIQETLGTIQYYYDSEKNQFI